MCTIFTKKNNCSNLKIIVIKVKIVMNILVDGLVYSQEEYPEKISSYVNAVVQPNDAVMMNICLFIVSEFGI